MVSWLKLWSRILLEKLVISPLVNKFPPLCWTPWFFSMLTTTLHWILFITVWIQCTSSHHVLTRSIQYYNYIYSFAFEVVCTLQIFWPALCIFFLSVPSVQLILLHLNNEKIVNVEVNNHCYADVMFCVKIIVCYKFICPKHNGEWTCKS